MCSVIRAKIPVGLSVSGILNWPSSNSSWMPYKPPVFSPNDILEAYHGKYFDKLGNKERFPDDEIIRRTQKYLLEKDSEPVTVKKQEKPEPKEEKVKKEAPAYLTENARKIYDSLSDEPMHIDEIIGCCGLSTEKTLSAITELEIYGLVTQLSGRRYKI